MGLGLFDTADNSLMIFMLGPKTSRPFTQSLHAFVGVGFVVGSFLVQPFLPQEQDDATTVCPGVNDNSTTTEEFQHTMLGNIPSINWPYIIIGVWHFLTAFGMIALGISGIEMPRYSSEYSGEKSLKFTNVKFWKTLFVMIYFYYFFTCGLEGFFMSMTYTYGLCGPLQMPPTEAGWLNSLYYGAFVFGRLLGIAISRYLEPATIIFASLSGCVTSALVLSILAGSSKIGLYLGTFVLGFSLSFLFASGISWTANLYNITGKASFIFFLGAFSGFLSIPPLAGAIFTMDETKVGFFYLAFAITILHTLLFIAMVKISRIKMSPEDSPNSDP